VRLRQLYTGELTWRELAAYLAQLPLESATQTLRMAELSDNDFAELAEQEHTHGPWSHTDLLLAALIDSVERLTYVQVRRGGVKTATPPKPVPRPGIPAAASRGRPTASAESRAYLERLRARHRTTQK